MSHAPEQLEMWSVEAAPEKRATPARCALAACSALEGGPDTDADFWGLTARAKARAEFWKLNGSRLEGRLFKLRRSIPDWHDEDLMLKKGFVVFFREGLWRTRKRVGCMIVRPNPHLLRLRDLMPLRNAQ